MKERLLALCSALHLVACAAEVGPAETALDESAEDGGLAEENAEIGDMQQAVVNPKGPAIGTIAPAALSVTPTGISGCVSSFEVAVKVSNHGGKTSDETVSVFLRAQGTYVPVSLFPSEAPGGGATGHIDPPRTLNVQALGRLAHVRVAGDATKTVRVPVNLPLPPYTIDVTVTAEADSATAVPSRRTVAQWRRTRPYTVVPIAFEYPCF